MKYIVKCTAGSENSLVNANLYDPNNVTEFIGFDDQSNEIYEIETQRDLDRVLDLSGGVIEYERSET